MVTALSHFGQDPSHYYVFNDQFNEYFDVQHPPTPTQFSRCTTTTESPNIDSNNINVLIQILTGKQTYTLPIFSITKINGVAAPASCTTLENYQYTTNSNYVLHISTGGCTVS